ncbi:MAG TPA: tetratricopeptide repeat protein [Pyrinomonadaceae bacterium]|nr:tetratricopeptide repeat protein [Pyrinomonadaceae bacterium]
MNLATQLAAIGGIGELTKTDRALHSCHLAKELEKAGEYEAACEALSEFWFDRAASPKVEGLDRQATADVFLRTGALIGWLGGAKQSQRQESAKDLITRSIELFTELGESERIAEAQSELALCYWREGALDEARVTLTEARRKITDNNSDLKAVALIRSGVIEEKDGRLIEALRWYDESQPLVARSTDNSLKGSFHLGRGTIFTSLGTAGQIEDCYDSALIEFAAASVHFEQAGHMRQCARVENNLGFLYQSIGRFPEAHEHINRARDIFLSLGDEAHVAQVNDTRARALLAEGRYREAERYARVAVKTLDRGDECSLLVEALTTHGTALARLGNYSTARSQLNRAIEAGENCGDLEGAGRAKLSIIEELSGQTSASEMASIFKSALEVLKESQDPSATRRLFASAATVIDTFEIAEGQSVGSKAEGSEGLSFKKEVHAFERTLLERALREGGGSVSKASRLLGFRHHQSLISLINTRHQELLKTRSVVRKRRRHIVSKPKASKKARTSEVKPHAGQVSVLHVEDNKQVANVIKDFLSSEGMHIDSCGNGMTALRILTGDARYDVVIVDNDLPGLSGLELVRRVHKITHRRKTPIIMLSGDEIETEAWRAGVKEFLRKPQDIDRVASTVERLVTRGKKKIKD